MGTLREGRVHRKLPLNERSCTGLGIMGHECMLLWCQCCPGLTANTRVQNLTPQPSVDRDYLLQHFICFVK